MSLPLDADALVADIERTLSNYFKNPLKVGEAAAAVLLVVERQLRQDRGQAIERAVAALKTKQPYVQWEGVVKMVLAAAEGRET